MRIKFLTLTLILVFSSVFASCKPPELVPNDVHTKVNEFLYNHISQKTLSEDIMKRTLNNYIELLDPLKNYFTHEDIKEWLNPSEDLLKEVLSSYYKNDFFAFEQIYQKMLFCIDRRANLDTHIEEKTPIDNLSYKDIDEKTWCESSQDLEEKLHKTFSLQKKYAKKFDPDFEKKFFILLKKRRSWREKEIIGESKEDQTPTMYAYLLKSIASALDSQTDYFPPDEAKVMLQQVQQSMRGIGVRLIDDITGFKIVELVEGGPALEQGNLLVNDKIIAVDKEPVVGMDIHEAVGLIQGKENTTVQLTVLRETEGEEGKSQTLDVDVKRGKIVIEETRLQSYVEPYADGVIAHLVLHGFYQDATTSSAEDLYNKICDLKEKHSLKGIVLDLRNNGGGFLLQGVAISSFFIGKGIVASTKQYDGTLMHYRNEQPNIVWDGPLIVLMNKASASCSEIVAQCLQDYGRAIVVGDSQSFGKGTYQIPSIMPNDSSVNPKGEYKITQGMYYTVSGKTPQIVGVASDVVVPGYLCETEYGERFSKYPVPNSPIEANYDDKLYDVLPWNRSYYKKHYLNNLQTKVQTFSKHLATLRTNSEARIKENKDYQHFLKVLKSEDESEENHVASNDQQLKETFDIMKDLIYLYEKDQALKAS